MSDRPWETEPHEAAFIANGLQCFMMRNDMQVWCGYVGVPASHVLYELDRLDLVPFPETWRDRHVLPDEQGIVNVFLSMFRDARNEIPESHAPLAMVLSAHGGLSFSGRLSSWPDLWFFGFDCGHAGDYSPGLHQVLLGSGYLQRGPDFAGPLFSTYRTFDYVQSEVISLSDQIANFGDLPAS
ncbi:hypothetical protein [Paraburkholderia sp. MM5477-R1]|uniref:hypothetical protein n=1 Tax=Paraburkholderia sp. MM5477-R1 TaxID=2991062 RepID=UPI003D194029